MIDPDLWDRKQLIRLNNGLKQRVESLGKQLRIAHRQRVDRIPTNVLLSVIIKRATRKLCQINIIRR